MNIRLILTVVLSACLFSTAYAQASKKPLRAAGKVETVTQDSLTILLPGNNKITLVVDKETKLTGRGLAGKTNVTTQEGRPASLDGLIKASDSVVVTYSDAGAGKLHATEIHVRLIAQ